MLEPPPAYPLRLVRVGAFHLGAFFFKGCGNVDMICVGADTLPAPPELPDGVPQRGKGVQISIRVGPVAGLQDCEVLLPNPLPALQAAWAAAAAVEGAASHARQLRKHASGTSSSRFGRASLAATFSPFREAPDTARSVGTHAEVWPPPQLAPQLSVLHSSAAAGSSAEELGLAPRSHSASGLLQMQGQHRRASGGNEGPLVQLSGSSLSSSRARWQSGDAPRVVAWQLAPQQPGKA